MYKRYEPPIPLLQEAKHLDPYCVIERAAIMEYCANLPRQQAEALAAHDADVRRPRAYGDTVEVEANYKRYISLWQPPHPGDLPSPPPNTKNNAPLWSSFWQKVEEGQNDG